MKKAAMVTSGIFLQDGVFNIEDPVLNRDNCRVPYHRLREKMAQKGFHLATQDIHPVEDSEIVIFNDMPASIPPKKPGQRFYLLAYESVAVLPRNFDMRLYRHFDKVFTWKDDIVDGKTIIKINYAYNLTPLPWFDADKRKKLLCLFANNKLSTHPDELYSERVRAITYFDREHPAEFDLFGSGWDYSFGGYYIMKLQEKFAPFRWGFNLLRALRIDRLFSRKLSTYRGKTAEKIPVLRDYRFNICFENVYGIPGYITEKIFDCLLAGCIPVYLGAPNIADHVPADCFIDMRNFKSYDDLYRFLKGMGDTDFNQYLEAIRAFLKSEKARAFDADTFADTMVSHFDIA